MLACALLVVASCSKSAESHEVENKTTEGAKATGTAETTPGAQPDREIKDTVDRPKVADPAAPAAGEEQAPADSEPPAVGAAAVKDSVKPHKGHAAVGEAKSQIVALKSMTLAETAEYKLVLVVPDGAQSGKEDSVKVKLTPKKGWKLNKEFPTKLKVSPPTGVKVKKAKQNAGDAVKFSEKSGAEWHVKFTSSSAGKKDFGGDFRFAVCTESTCDPKKEKLAFAVNVK